MKRNLIYSILCVMVLSICVCGGCGKEVNSGVTGTGNPNETMSGSPNDETTADNSDEEMADGSEISEGSHLNSTAS